MEATPVPSSSSTAETTVQPFRPELIRRNCMEMIVSARKWECESLVTAEGAEIVRVTTAVRKHENPNKLWIKCCELLVEVS